MDELSKVNVGMLGYGFMGRAHVHALQAIPLVYGNDAATPRLLSIAGRNREGVMAAAERFGFAEVATDWRELVEDPRIILFDNTGPNDVHAEPTIAAAQAGKHILCEKPLGRTAEEALRMWDTAARAGVVHMCGFNYRFVPAVALARQLVAAGEIGEVVHFRATYLQDWLVDQSVSGLWRLDGSVAGSGALGDLGSHIVDLGRYLVGEIDSVSGAMQTFTPERAGVPVTVDDAFVATVRFASGALGTLEASRSCPGRKNTLRFEVNGTRGSLAFDLERLNELGHSRGQAGFRTILVTEPEHPYMSEWWPAGHIIGWEHTFVHELRHMLKAIDGSATVAPLGATFEDGYRATEVCDAIRLSADTAEQISINYRVTDAVA